jgi:hypothetical protein
LIRITIDSSVGIIRASNFCNSHVADLLGVSSAEYTSNQMTYDLRRLRLKGLLVFIDSRAHNYAERSACLVFRQPVQGGALGPSAAPPLHHRRISCRQRQSLAAFGMSARA